MFLFNLNVLLSFATEGVFSKLAEVAAVSTQLCSIVFLEMCQLPSMKLVPLIFAQYAVHIFIHVLYMHVQIHGKYKHTRYRMCGT